MPWNGQQLQYFDNTKALYWKLLFGFGFDNIYQGGLKFDC